MQGPVKWQRLILHMHCVDICNGEMVAAPPEDAECWLHLDMKLEPDNESSRELCAGHTVRLFWAVHT